MRKSFTMYSDPSHGWLKVKLVEVKELSIDNIITGFSHIRGEYLYLEEDCDAYVFIKEYEKKYGFKPTNVSQYTDKRSRIRNYDYYKYDNNELMGVTII